MVREYLIRRLVTTHPANSHAEIYGNDRSTSQHLKIENKLVAVGVGRMADVEGKCRSLPSTLNQLSEDTITARSLHRSKPGRLDATSTSDSQNESSSKRHRPLETHSGAKGGQSSGQRPVGASDLPVFATQKPEPKPRSLLSHETMVNIRYSRDGHKDPDHPNEDDTVIVQGANMKLFAVLDGHDGNNAVKFVSGYLRTTGFIELVNSAKLNEDVFEELFRKMDNGFFNDIRFHTNKKKKLQQKFKVSACNMKYSSLLAHNLCNKIIDHLQWVWH